MQDLQNGLASFRQILTPLPVIFPEKKLALMFSAKAGSTFALKWFLHQMGLLENAEKYNSWVHRYRKEVIYLQPGYGEHFKRLLNNEFTVVKIVRNPYARAVSSYIHALKHGYENHGISEMLGRDNVSGFSFSFAEFLDYLSTIRLTACNVHHRLQVQAPELAGILKVDEKVKLEESDPRLRTIEKKYSLLPCSPGAFSSSSHHTARSDMEGFCGDKRFQGGMKEGTGITRFPCNENFYNRQLRERVAGLYKKDFEAYDYHI